MLGSDLPLILAANEPPAFIYRSVNTYPHLALATLGGQRSSDGCRAGGKRALGVCLYRDEISSWAARFAEGEPQGRATSDIAQAARAATIGAVDTMLVEYR